MKKQIIHQNNFTVTKDMVTNGTFNRKLPDVIIGDFICEKLHLTTLEGCPQEIVGIFKCSFNRLTNLEGGPKIVNALYDCSNNKLKTLKGSCEEVYNFDAYNNPLINLEFSPKKYHRNDYRYLGASNEFNFFVIEREFILSGRYREHYWKDLMHYMIDNKVNLHKIDTWPKKFMNRLEPQYKNLFKSTKTINRFSL